MARLEIRFVSPHERVHHLGAAPFLRSLSVEDLAVLAQHVSEEHTRRGRTLFSADETIDAVRVIVEGEVLVRRFEERVRLLGPGTPLGMIAALAGRSHGVDATARRATLSLRLDLAALLDIMEDRFSIMHHLLRATARQLRTERLQAAFEGLPAPTEGRVDGQPEELVDRFTALTRALPFGGADPLGLWHLAERSEAVRFQEGERLYRCEAASPDVVILLRGEVAGQREGDTLLRLGPGDAVGATDMLAEMPRSYDAIAVTDTVGVRLNREVLLDVCEDHFSIGLACLRANARALLDALQARASVDDAVPSGLDSLG